MYDVGFSALKSDKTGAFNALTTADEKLKGPLTRAVDLPLISTVQMATVALPLHLYKGWSGFVIFTLWPTLLSLLSSLSSLSEQIPATFLTYTGVPAGTS